MDKKIEKSVKDNPMKMIRQHLQPTDLEIEQRVSNKGKNVEGLLQREMAARYHCSKFTLIECEKYKRFPLQGSLRNAMQQEYQKLFGDTFDDGHG